MRLRGPGAGGGQGPLLPRRERSTPEADLVSVGVSIGRFSDSVRVGLPLSGLGSSGGDLGDHRIEVAEEERVHRIAGVLRPLHDEQEPMLGELPRRLRAVGDEAGLRTQEAFGQTRSPTASRYSFSKRARSGVPRFHSSQNRFSASSNSAS